VEKCPLKSEKELSQHPHTSGHQGVQQGDGWCGPL
jgi:hypothetical protein